MGLYTNSRYVNVLAEFQTGLAAKLRASGQESQARLHDLDQVFFAGDETAELRAKLILEEARELAWALTTENKAQVLKEQCDLLYVTFALTPIYDLHTMCAFNRVHANNMRKIDSGIINEYGKLVKPMDFPKVVLTDLI